MKDTNSRKNKQKGYYIDDEDGNDDMMMIKITM